VGHDLDLIAFKRAVTGDTRGMGLEGREPGTLRVARDRHALNVGIVAVEPAGTLRQRLRMRADARDADHVAAAAQQMVAHRHRHLAADLQRAVQKQVEAAIDRTLARILDRHDTKIDHTGFGLAKNFIDADTGHRLDAMPEPGDHRLLGEGPCRPEVSHPQLALEFATG